MKHIVFLIVVLLSLSMSAQSSKRKQLEAKKKALKEEIKMMNKLLFSNKKESASVLSQLESLNKKIQVHLRLIHAIKEETKALSKEIASNEKRIADNQRQLKLLKVDYAQLVRQSYKSRSKQSRIMFLLSSKDFIQAYKRIQYMKQYADFRKRQGMEISRKTKRINSLNNALKAQQKKKAGLLAETQKEVLLLEKEEKTQKKLATELKKKQKYYTAQIRRKEKEEKKIDVAIKQLIRKAIADLKKRKTSGKPYVLTKEAKKLAADFRSNRGKLPWPVEKGLIVKRFGKVRHPSLKNLMLQSNGVDIVTYEGAKARAVFKGEVLAIQLIKTGNKNVIIKHGNYFTVYYNLDKVFVKKGEKVDTKQPIGEIHTDRHEGRTTLKFQVWKETSRLNPAHWIYKM